MMIRLHQNQLLNIFSIATIKVQELRQKHKHINLCYTVVMISSSIVIFKPENAIYGSSILNMRMSEWISEIRMQYQTHIQYITHETFSITFISMGATLKKQTKKPNQSHLSVSSDSCFSVCVSVVG